jgi:hypothetical protein
VSHGDHVQPVPRRLANNEVGETDRHAPVPGLEPADEDEAEEFEIDAEFRRRLSALRRMPRQERPLALLAAREWRRLALKALREKRDAKRGWQYAVWRSRLALRRLE